MQHEQLIKVRTAVGGNSGATRAIRNDDRRIQHEQLFRMRKVSKGSTVEDKSEDSDGCKEGNKSKVTFRCAWRIMCLFDNS